MKGFFKAIFLTLSFVSLCFITQISAANAIEVIDIYNNNPITAISSGDADWIHYRINIPSGSSNLSMSISGGSGDADMYTRYSSQPTTDIFDCRPYASGNNEECTVANPQAGYYYIGIYKYSSYSNVTLTTSYSTNGDDQELTNNQTINISGNQQEWKHYYINVPADSYNLVMSISGGSGDADLYTQFGTQPTSNTYDCRPYKSNNDETCTVTNPQTGNYYISIHGYSAYSTSLEVSYQDGQPPTGDKTFIITAVQDNLDNQDMYDLADGLTNLGYTKHLEDTNVYSSELINYLGQSVTTLYHTGHGNNGSIATYDGSITASDSTLVVENTFIATCLTLTDTSWKNSFSSSAKTFMGYTNYSYDYTDETVAKNIVAGLGNNQSYELTWYLSNSGISSLSDRWAEYVRENNSIVEYSARTGNIPSSTKKMVMVKMSDRVFWTTTLENNFQTHEDSFKKNVSVEPDNTITFASPAGFSLLGSVSGNEQQAVTIAKTWLAENWGLPADAVFDRATPIQRMAGPDGQFEIVGYSIHYRRDIDGLQISGNRIQDHLTILVGSDSVVGASRYWPGLTADAFVSKQKRNLLTVSQAIESAVDEIARVLKGQEAIHLMDAEPVYGTYGPMDSRNQLIPAFKVRSQDGNIFIINALTGKLLL
ncbi:MAG: hypothetical protein GY710_15400 [Desulfobacteraceae bacterium]|nr:hypothetical protein [Desulfobacteraceae bacterium]